MTVLLKHRGRQRWNKHHGDGVTSLRLEDHWNRLSTTASTNGHRHARRCNMHLSEISNTLNSVGTISLGVSKPINKSRPTKHRIDRKIEKSLISFLIYRPGNRRKEGQRSEGRETDVHRYREGVNMGGITTRREEIIVTLMNMNNFPQFTCCTVAEEF